MKRVSSHGLLASWRLVSNIFLLACLFISTSAILIPISSAQQSNPAVSSEDKTQVSFDEKLRFYLNDKTQRVVETLLAREVQLLQMVRNIHKEVAARGEKGIESDQPAFREIYGKEDSLIAQYGVELDSLMSIFEAMQRLQRVADYAEDLQLFDSVMVAKNQVAAAIENRRLYKKGAYSPERVGGMVDEYTSEMDSLIGVFDALEKYKVLATAQNDQDALRTIQNAKGQLLKVFSQWGSLGPLSEEDFLRYKVEMQRVQDVSKNIDNIAKTRGAEQAGQVALIKKDLLSRIDNAVFDLMTKSEYAYPSYPTVSDFVDAWKEERVTDAKTRITKYEVMRKSLIERGDDKERDRMLAQEIGDALLNYSDGLFQTAEVQLGAILDAYGPYYANLIPVKFYLSECRYQRMAYDAARDGYLEIIRTAGESPYHAESLVRMMQYSQDFGTSAEFFEYYNQAMKDSSLASRDLIYYAHYLAANKYFENSQYTQAKNALLKIPANSEFYLPSQLLLAVVHTNLDDFDSAIPILTKLSDKKNYPWTNLNTAYIRNTSLLRLGMIHYQRGEFANAITTFDQVSQGFEGFDEALIGQAWANLSIGYYDVTIERTHSLLRNYLASNFTYEALVLSAHCKRLLNQPENALNAYRYVVRAHGMMNMQSAYDKERDRVLSHVKELSRLESTALERREAPLYSQVSELRNQLNEYLLRVKEPGDTGTELIQDYYDERIDMLDQLSELDRVIDWAREQGRVDVEDKAAKQRARLVKVLETFRSDRDVTNTSYLVDFPLAAREANNVSTRESLASALRDMDLEKRRIEIALNSIKDINGVQEAGQTPTRNQVEILQDDLNDLRDRISQFRKWLVDAKPEEPNSDVDHWSDLSGFGISDIIYTQRKEKLVSIDDFATRLKTIDGILISRRDEIGRQLEKFEEEARVLQNRLLSRKIQLEQMERQTYFDNLYFDKKESEVEPWEEYLRQTIEP
jgi:hypothetical protein